MDINITNPVTASKIGEVVNASASATPNDTDLVMSVDTSVAKKNTWTQIKAFLKTYFDTIYQAAGSYLTSANITQVITNGVTDKAPSEDAVFDALALKQNIVAGVDDTEIGYLNGVTSAIQTQLNNNRIYLILGNQAATTFSPADSTTYYYGTPAATTTQTSSGRAIIVPSNLTIKEITISAWVNSTIGSNETGTYSIVEVNGTNLSVVATTQFDTTFTWDSANRQNTKVISGLNISVTEGNYIMVKYDSPAWATNPTNTWVTFLISLF